MLAILIRASTSSFGYENLVIDSKSYADVVDLKEMVNSIGGLEIINVDPIKQQTLSKMIQANPEDLKSELEAIFLTKKKSSTTISTPSETSSIRNSGVVSINIGENSNSYSIDSTDQNLYTQKKKRSFFSFFFPCFGSKVSDPDLKKGLL